MLVKAQKVNGKWGLINQNGQEVEFSRRPTSGLLNRAVEGDHWIQVTEFAGTTKFRISKANSPKMNKVMKETEIQTNPIERLSHEEIKELILGSPDNKPVDLKVTDATWKYLTRSVLRGKNIMMTGPSGSGKTVTVQKLVKTLGKEWFYFNLGATQDPRSTLIGNTHFRKGEGTLFSESLFVKAIQKPGTVILLDELTRAHPEAWNILIPVLDPNQRYLRLDEEIHSKTIKVAEGVCFIATANMGREYTSTRVLDRAILDRFTIIEMNPLGLQDELDLLTLKFPDLNHDDLYKIAELADYTRRLVKEDTGVLTTIISTRMSEETASLIWDGFSLLEACEISILPFFSSDGGLQSERTHILQWMEKWSEPVTPLV